MWHYIPHEIHILAHLFHTTRIACGCMWKNLDIYSRKSTIKPHVTLHSTWNTHTCTLFPHNKINMWMHVEKCEHEQQKNPRSNPVWHYILHKMHILAHYFHTTRITFGCMSKNLNINSKKYTVKWWLKSHAALHSTWNTHACTLFSRSKNNMWIHNCSYISIGVWLHVIFHLKSHQYITNCIRL